MVSVATRCHQTASALLLQTSRALSRDFLDVETVAHTLREAFIQAARSFLAQRTLFGGEKLAEDAVIADWFDLAPRSLGSKGATVLRKLNFLSYGSPYRPVLDGEPDWDVETIRGEFARIADEIAQLLTHDTVGSPLPSFRGEEDTCPPPGSVVTYSLYDWDMWSQATCVVVRSHPPQLLLRFADRHYEEIDATISLVQPIPGQRANLDEPFEARRTRFELLLYDDDVGLYDDPYFPPTLGIGRAVITCACCGYPTRRLQFPAFLHLQTTTSGLERCPLCGWNQEPEPIAFNADGTSSIPPPLREARAQVRASLVAFAPDDDSEIAAQHRNPLRLAQVERARILYDGLLAADTPQERTDIWAATQKILSSLRASPQVRGQRHRGEQRVTIAVQQALASL